MLLKVIKQKLTPKTIRRGHYHHILTHSHKLKQPKIYTRYSHTDAILTKTTDYVI